jgi:hypothetical protein
MSVKRDTAARILHMGCGESLLARVSLAIRHLELLQAGGLARRSGPKPDEGRR